MIITITRSDTATKGLIVVSTDQTSATSLRLYKPTELNELSLVDIGDGTIRVSMVIGQENYLTETNGVDALIINGVNQFGQTATQLSDTLSALFLDSSAGGGAGTVINPTDEYLPYRVNAATFGDSSIKQSIAPAGNDFKLDAGKVETSISMHNDGIITKKIRIGNAQPVVSPYNGSFIEIDALLELIKMVGTKEVQINNPAISAALGIFKTEDSTVSLGDVNDLLNSTKIIIDDIAKTISLQANEFIEITSVKGVFLGDTQAVSNSTIISIDDVGQVIVINSNTGLIRIQELQEHANNAAAITAGLLGGNLYRTGDTVKVVHIP